MTIQPDIDSGVALGFLIELGKKLDREEEWRRKHSEVVFQQPITGQLAVTGTLDEGSVNSRLAPPRGHCWSIRRLVLTGPSAGTFTAFLNGVEPVAFFSAADADTMFQYYPNGAIICQPGDKLSIVSAAQTGALQLFGVADTFPFWYLREYLD